VRSHRIPGSWLLAAFTRPLPRSLAVLADPMAFSRFYANCPKSPPRHVLGPQVGQAARVAQRLRTDRQASLERSASSGPSGCIPQACVGGRSALARLWRRRRIGPGSRARRPWSAAATRVAQQGPGIANSSGVKHCPLWCSAGAPASPGCVPPGNNRHRWVEVLHMIRLDRRCRLDPVGARS
jgi:hypothetical protein